MLYPTINQPYVILIIFLVGFASGILFDIANILSKLSNDKFAKVLFDFLAVIFSFFILFYSNLHINYGQFRFYIVAIFLLAIMIERFISKILWTKCIKKCYNKLKEKKYGKEKNH